MSRISFELENISEIRSAILLLFAFYKTEGHTFQVILQTEHHLFINLFILFLNVHSKIIYFVTSRCSSSPIYEESKKKKKKLHPLLGYALQLQQSDINISEQP